MGKELTEELLTKKIARYAIFEKHHQIVIRNAHLYHQLWESDVVSVLKSKFVCEYEIKLSYIDFRADFRKKSKHEALANKGELLKSVYIYGRPNSSIWIPNRFYYVCPENIIPEDKIPKYAGLIYCFPPYNPYSDIKVIKKAPLLTNKKCDEKLFRELAIKLSSRLLNAEK